MSLLRPFLEGRTVLGVPADADAATIKRAYRKLALAHPPDTDPTGFRRVRDAYELLTDPAPRLREMLLQPQPTVDPPPLPGVPEPPPAAALPLVLLRLAAARVDTAELLAAPGAAAPTPEPAGAAERSPTR